MAEATTEDTLGNIAMDEILEELKDQLESREIDPGTYTEAEKNVRAFCDQMSAHEFISPVTQALLNDLQEQVEAGVIDEDAYNRLKEVIHEKGGVEYVTPRELCDALLDACMKSAGAEKDTFEIVTKIIEGYSMHRGERQAKRFDTGYQMPLPAVVNPKISRELDALYSVSEVMDVDGEDSQRHDVRLFWDASCDGIRRARNTAYRYVGATVSLNLKNWAPQPAEGLDEYYKFWIGNKDAVVIKSIIYKSNREVWGVFVCPVPREGTSEEDGCVNFGCYDASNWKPGYCEVAAFPWNHIDGIIDDPHGPMMRSRNFLGMLEEAHFDLHDLCEPILKRDGRVEDHTNWMEYFHYSEVCKVGDKQESLRSAGRNKVVAGVLISASEGPKGKETPIELETVLAIRVPGTCGQHVMYWNGMQEAVRGRKLFLPDKRMHPLAIPLMSLIGQRFLENGKRGISGIQAVTDDTPEIANVASHFDNCAFDPKTVRVDYLREANFKTKSNGLQSRRNVLTGDVKRRGPQLQAMIVDVAFARGLSAAIRTHPDGNTHIQQELQKAKFTTLLMKPKPQKRLIDSLKFGFVLTPSQNDPEDDTFDAETADKRLQDACSYLKVCSMCMSFMDGRSDAKLEMIACKKCPFEFCSIMCAEGHNKTMCARAQSKAQDAKLDGYYKPKTVPTTTSSKKNKKNRAGQSTTPRSSRDAELEESERKRIQDAKDELEKKRKQREEADRIAAKEEADKERERKKLIEDERAERLKREEEKAAASDAARGAEAARRREIAAAAAAAERQAIEAETAEERRQAAMRAGHIRRDREAIVRDFNARQVHKHETAIKQKDERQQQRVKEEEAQRSKNLEARRHTLPPKAKISDLIR